VSCASILAPHRLPAAEPTNAARVLIVTGQDWPGHLWRETAPTLRRLLEEDPRLSVRILEDPHALDTSALTNYAVVLLHFQNWQQPGPGAAARENLRRFVERGGGLMSVHFACGAWQGEWPEFANLIGRVWDPKLPGHDPRGPFTVRIADRQHPVTRGLEDFETDDELYTCLTGDAPIRLLAAAKSKVDGREHPMAFVRHYGRGRVFLTTLGHDVKAFTCSRVPQLLRQACLWTAGLEP
jgi:type 1 glutamine amidotransferase